MVVGNLGIDSIFWTLGNQLLLQLKILQHRLRRMNMIQVDKKDVVDLIEMHKKIFEYLEDINDIFKPIMFFQLILGAIVICVIGFEIVVVFTTPLNDSSSESLILPFCRLKISFRSYCA